MYKKQACCHHYFYICNKHGNIIQLVFKTRFQMSDTCRNINQETFNYELIICYFFQHVGLNRHSHAKRNYQSA